MFLHKKKSLSYAVSIYNMVTIYNEFMWFYQLLHNNYQNLINFMQTMIKVMIQIVKWTFTKIPSILFGGDDKFWIAF